MASGDQPAFPSYYGTPTPGMTLRQWFAGMALQGLLANPHRSEGIIAQIESLGEVTEFQATAAFEYADAMLAHEQESK